MFRRINLFKHLYQLHKTSHLVPKVNPSVVRNATTDKSTPTFGQDNWTEIYRLPLIRLASAFNRLKVYQTLVTLAGTPIAFSLEHAGHLDPSTGVIFAALGISGALTLTLCSFPVTNFIGFVYMNDDSDKVKLAYVDFWGRRKEHELYVEEILAPWELPPQRINIYQQIKSREDESKCFKLLYRYGKICDPQRYVSVFGDDNK